MTHFDVQELILKRRISFSLGLYLAKRFFITIVATTLILICLMGLIDFIEISRKISGLPYVTGDIILHLMLMKMPYLIIKMLPFSVLIGSLTSFAKLTKDHEIIAIRSSGIPARHFLKPAFYVCFGIGLFVITLLNPFAATTLKNYQKVEQSLFPNKTHGYLTDGGQIWLRQPEKDKELIIHSRSVKDEGRRLEKAKIFVNDKNGNFIKRIDAENMRLRDGKWLLDMPVTLEPRKETLKETSIELPTTLTAEMIRHSFTSPQTLSIWELWRFIHLLKQSGFPTLEHEMHLQSTLSYPALILAMFLLAVPFALQFSRNQSLLSIVVVGVGLGFSFYLLTNFMNAYGISGRIDVIIAAWLPILIAGCIGLFFFLHFREE